MDLMPGAEQEAIRDAIRGLLADRLPSARLRHVMTAEVPLDRDLWTAAAGLGWFGLHLSEDAGGAGYGTAEAMLLFVELGRALAPGPWLGTVLAAAALARTPAARSTLARVLDGRLRFAVADDSMGALGSSARVDGTLRGILDLGAADAVLLLGPQQTAWLRMDAAGVGGRAVPGMDPTRRLGTLRAAGVAAEPLDADPAALRRLGTVLAAGEAVGVAERALAMSVEYAKVRQQFGKPIGTFQAIKHRCADMATRTEVARASTTWAAVALDDDAADAATWVHAAKALATRAALENAHDNVQNHGGMGYTWESDAHLLLKRARVLEHCFGSRTAHLDALAAPWRVPL